ncbi:MAG: DUF6519 domain-containing protein [Nitrospirota bacterium]|nr:DUF6519 domain-containing protein [Nitrospirota bacterium]MDH4362064.1 DUF6519 domain-containing protein [Nitrospirota bacterium]
MKHGQVSIAFTLYLLLMGCALTAFAQPPVEAKSSGEFPVLQLNIPAQFLSGDGLPLHIHSGAYLVTASPPDQLQLTSTSTGEAQNLHATTIAHTESLTAPYPFLIEEAEEQGHVHLILLLPNGQGLDAEGRREQIQGRGIGDMTKLVFTPTRRYSGVVMQQGRVATDDDLNEQEAVSSSTMSGLLSKVAPSYGRVTLEQGRIQLDAKARQSLLRRCRICAKKQ